MSLTFAGGNMQKKSQLSRPLTNDEIYAKKERYYRRNFITLLFESFFFSSALAMFSPEAVLPVYVKHLSDKPFFIALISVISYGLSYGVYIFSCPIGVNAKSPKWVSVGICFLQRIGFFFIYLSTYAVTRSQSTALFMFFISLSVYAVSAGLSSPLFSQMVSVSIHKNVGTFYGAYALAGAVSGVLGSLVFNTCLKNFDFPKDFRMTFFIALMAALIATVVVSVGVREVTDDRVINRIRMKEVFPLCKKIILENKKFRQFTLIRVLLGAAEFALPYYIIIASSKTGAPEGYVGTLATIFLVAKMISALLAGKIGDKFGPVALLMCACICGGTAAFLAITAQNWQLATIMYIIVAFANNGIMIATSTATVVYSDNGFVPVYSATVSLLCAPLYILVSFGGAAIASHFSYNAMFSIALAVYLVGAVLSIYFLKKD